MYKIFNFNDIHTGKTGRTRRIVDNINEFFIRKDKELSDVKLIVMTGDFFDKMLTTVSLDYKLAVLAIVRLVLYCKKNNIKLRFLEGTPSHDNKQMESISVAIEELVKNIDYKYISTLTIEDIDGYKCLFLPDKWRGSGVEIQEAITEKLKEHNLTKVDMSFVHGNFKYQLPVSIKSELDEQFFLDITRYYIVAGHIHDRSEYLRILVPGSFDRVDPSTNDKGGLITVLGKTPEESNYYFLNNESPMVYDTIDLTKLDVAESLRMVMSHIKKKNLNEYDTLRLDADIIKYKEIVDVLIEKNIPVRIIRKKDKKEKIVSTVTTVDVVRDVVDITADNIIPMLLGRESFKDLTESDIRDIESILKCLIDDL